MHTNTDVTNNDPHFRNLIDNGIIDNTLEGKILFVNQALASMLEFESPEQMQAESTLLRWCDPEDRKAFISRLKQQGYVNNYEAEVFSKTGKHLHVLLSARLQGDVISSMVVDITERKQAEVALRNSEKRFRDIAENASEWIWEVDGNGKYTYVSPVVEKLLGYKTEEILQKHFYDLFHPDDKEELKQAAFEAFAGKERFNEFINRAVHKNGTVVWLSTSGIPIIDESGELVGYRGADKDITKRKLAEDALLESEEKFRTLVTNTEEIVYMVAKDGIFLLSEGKGLAKLGLKPGQVVGESVFELYKDYPDMLDDMRRVFNGETVTNEVNVDGNYFRSWYTPHENHEGEIIGLLGLSVNITEQKQAEEKLQDYQQRLRALASELTLTEERERRNIALDLHDHVGQSLAVMRMQLAVAQKESGGRKVATILDEVSNSLHTAIQDTRNVISDLSSPLINELGLAAALSEWLKERIGEHYGLETQFIDNGEPKPLGADTEAILFRSVRELLTNVVKHANANRVSISLQRRGSAIQIVVEDDGVGLTDGRHSEKNNTESGFGLFSIKERMSDLGGSLEIESHPGRGVRAILTAPLEPGHGND
jgi:PAS domain S-box-containing protein